MRLQGPSHCWAWVVPCIELGQEEERKKEIGLLLEEPMPQAYADIFHGNPLSTSIQVHSLCISGLTVLGP